MALSTFKMLLLPMLIIVVINVAAGLVRTSPAGSQVDTNNEIWPQFELPSTAGDVREQLLAGGQWGERETQAATAQHDNNTQPALTEEGAMREYVQQQLLGIVYRGGWRLLFAQEADKALPLELQEGDTLPGGAWLVGRIFPDRIELLNSSAASTPVTISLYPIPDASTEL